MTTGETSVKQGYAYVPWGERCLCARGMSLGSLGRCSIPLGSLGCPRMCMSTAESSLCAPGRCLSAPRVLLSSLRRCFFCPAEGHAPCSNETAECWRTMRGCCGDMCVSSGEKHWFTGNKLVSPWEVLVDHREVLGVPRKIAGCPWRCLCTLRRC